MVHTVPFGIKRIGRYTNKPIYRISHPKVMDRQFIPNKDALYFYTPHTIRKNGELKEVKQRFESAGVTYFVESIWSKFNERCKALGMRCIPSFYELGLEIAFPKHGKELYPTHFGRSAFYDTLDLKHLSELFPNAKRRYKKNGEQLLVTAGRLNGKKADELTADYPFIDLRVFHPRKWIPECLAHVGTNVTATESDAGPRLFIYAARIGIPTVFIAPYLEKNMGEPLDILKPFMFLASSCEPDDLNPVIEQARSVRGKRILTHQAALDVLYSSLRSHGLKLKKLELFNV